MFAISYTRHRQWQRTSERAPYKNYDDIRLTKHCLSVQHVTGIAYDARTPHRPITSPRARLFAGLDRLLFLLRRLVRRGQLVVRRLDAPDLPGVLRDRAIGRKLTRRRDVHQRLAHPRFLILQQCAPSCSVTGSRRVFIFWPISATDTITKSLHCCLSSAVSFSVSSLSQVNKTGVVRFPSDC